MEECHDDQEQVAHDKGRRQQMHELEGVRVFLFQDDTRLARVFHLSEKRTELDSTLVVNESLWEKPTGISIGKDSGTQVDVLAVAHGSKASQGFENRLFYSKIEAAWIKLVQFLRTATDAACGEKRGHRIVDGLLYGRERRMSAVGAAKGVAKLAVKLAFDDFQIVFWHDDVRI